MAKHKYATTPPRISTMPPGIPYIVGNEAAERFSYYGMNSILVIFMTKYLMDAQGRPDLMSDKDAEGWYHMFVSWVYLLPLLGAFLADAVLGKYRTILILSVVYCFGHLALALDHTRMGLAVGLGLIALGAGGIKPCVSANVGDQFGVTNQHLLPRVFSWFYFSINLGSAFSTILIPELLERYGPKIAFGTPGIFMFIATVVFWFGRGPLHGDRRVPDRRVDSNTPRCRGPSEYPLANTGVRCPDGWRGDGFGDAPRVRLHPGAEENEVACDVHLPRIDCAWQFFHSQ